MRNVLRCAALGAFASVLACGGGGKSEENPGGVSQTVGTNGGTVSLPGGPSLVIPPGALAADTAISIQKAAASAPSGALTALYQFGPAGTAFSAPVTVSFAVPQGTAAAAVYWTRVGSTTDFERLPTNLAGATATASVSHFSLGYAGPPGTYGISGTVAVGTTGLPGVTVTLGGAASRTTSTDASGTYVFAGLASGNYTVEASRPGYAFTPTGAVEVVIADAARTLDFAAAGNLQIRGNVSGASAVAVALTGKATVGQTTDGSGNYAFLGLEPGDYTVTPTKPGYAFSPASLSLTLTTASVAGQNFTASAAPTYAISGTVTGPWVEGVTVALSGGGLALTAVTSATGNYAFTGLPDGTTCTLTPSLAGYGFSPSAATVSIAGASRTQGFAAAAAVPGNRLGGTVAYAGSATGRIYFEIYDVGCGNCSSIHGTSIPSPAAYPAPFVIRGLRPGTYHISAHMDTLGTGLPNDSFPHSVDMVTTYTIVDADVLGASVTLVDPPAPTLTAPANLRALPGPGAAILFWDALRNQFGQENATGYRIYASTSPNPSSPAVFDIPATEGNPFIHYGTDVTDGTTWYYAIAAKFGATVGPPSAPVSALIGAPAGGSTVSSSVTFPGVTPTGPLFVGLYQESSGGGPADLRFLKVDAPVSGSSYAVPGVPAGTWQPFAIMDQDSNHLIDVGDVRNLEEGGGAPVTVPTGSTVSQTLSGAAATARAPVQHIWDGGTNHSYSVGVSVAEGVKLPVQVVVYSGRGLPLPMDLGTPHFETMVSLGATPPDVGDVYRARVTFSDATVQDLTASVTAVPDFFAQDLTENVASPYSRTVPLFQWSAPASPPASYAYSVAVGEAATMANIWFSGVPLPSTQTSVRYDADGQATQPSLTPGTAYLWAVYVVDPARNQAVISRSYTP